MDSGMPGVLPREARVLEFCCSVSPVPVVSKLQSWSPFSRCRPGPHPLLLPPPPTVPVSGCVQAKPAWTFLPRESSFRSSCSRRLGPGLQTREVMSQRDPSPSWRKDSGAIGRPGAATCSPQVTVGSWPPARACCLLCGPRWPVTAMPALSPLPSAPHMLQLGFQPPPLHVWGCWLPASLGGTRWRGRGLGLVLLITLFPTSG